jgi:hypothetical protein
MIDGSTDADAEKDKELRDFISGITNLDLFDALAHVERLLSVIQKWRMAGEQHTVEILEKGGMVAMDAHIQEEIRAGRAPEWAFFDPGAWDPESSDYGRLLEIQDLPDSAKLFFCKTVDSLALQIKPIIDGQADSDLDFFIEGDTYLEPAEITAHITRLLIKYVTHA